uniref:Putative secreted protein n=1 Tax=Ixodes ricinus TaxID=34613 RepID=A0A6B0UT27_IXORI
MCRLLRTPHSTVSTNTTLVLLCTLLGRGIGRHKILPFRSVSQKSTFQHTNSFHYRLSSSRDNKKKKERSGFPVPTVSRRILTSPCKRFWASALWRRTLACHATTHYNAERRSGTESSPKRSTDWTLCAICLFGGADPWP